VIAEPPFEAGAEKEIVAEPVPGVPVPIVGAPGTVAAIVIEKLVVQDPPVFVAVITPVKVPLAFGVPEAAPVLVFRETPPGSAPDVNAYVGAGEPVAAKECEYAVPNEPPGGDAAEHVGPVFAGVTLTVPDAGPVPCVFVARTEQE
jgi:hypothetical protein